MQTITTIGLDIAKSVFQVHGVDADLSHRTPLLKISNSLASEIAYVLPRTQQKLASSVLYRRTSSSSRCSRAGSSRERKKRMRPRRYTPGHPKISSRSARSFVAIDALAALVELLRFDRQCGNRTGIQPADRGRTAGLFAKARGAIVDAAERFVDLGGQLALAVVRTQLDGAIGLRGSPVGKVRVVLVLLLQVLKGLLRFLQDVFPPILELAAEIVPLVLIHERFFVGRLIRLGLGQHCSRNSNFCCLLLLSFRRVTLPRAGELIYVDRLADNGFVKARGGLKIPSF